VADVHRGPIRPQKVHLARLRHAHPVLEIHHGRIAGHAAVGVDHFERLHVRQGIRHRAAPEFVFNPRLGETYQEALDLKGNPSIEIDWYEAKFKSTNEPYRYTVAHWCATEARFRNHLKKIKPEDAAKLIPLESMLIRITQQDVVYRRYLVADHRSFVPDFGVYIKVQGEKGGIEYRTLSRQLVLFCVERRKAWRMLQSKAGIENREYKAQRALLADVDAGRISKEDLFAHAELLLKERLPVPTGHKPAAPAVAPEVAAAGAAGAGAGVVTTH
jgi:pyruvate-ferredoxin/flavodoxin oxidoreductase